MTKMNAARFFDWLQIAALAGLGFVATKRALILHLRGVRVVAAHGKPAWVPWLACPTIGIFLLLWAYEILACAWPLPIHIVPSSWRTVLVDAVPLKSAGAVLLGAGVFIYARALRDLDDSCCLGFDRETPGPLVTEGIYAWTRHPIYVGLTLFSLGTALVLGRLIFFAIALLSVFELHAVILFEERFLVRIHGDAYREYRSRVGRYLTWPGTGKARRPGPADSARLSPRNSNGAAGQSGCPRTGIKRESSSADLSDFGTCGHL
jgi:protein-S-isoprenylcysteine O-methyltransferase Ste14